MHEKNIGFGFVFILCIASFGAGVYVGRARYSESGTNYIDSAVLERVINYQREYIQTRQAELAEREKRLATTDRIIAADRAGYSEIERLARETIKAVNARTKGE